MVKRARRVVAVAASAEMPGFIKPQLAMLKAKAPSGDQWLHEIKFDGFPRHNLETAKHQGAAARPHRRPNGHSPGVIWILFLSKPSKQGELVGRSFGRPVIVMPRQYAFQPSRPTT
jgi:hypothetical protein